jgi:plastocyanin
MRNGVVSIVASAMALVACGGGGDGGTQPPTPVFTSLTLSAATLTMVDGDTAQLTATPRDQNGAAMTGLPGATFALTSGTAASVSTSGRVIALTQGSATVTASLTASGVTKTANSTVNVGPLPAAASVTASAAGTTFSPETVKVATNGQVTWSFPGQQHNVIWDGTVPPGGNIGSHSNGETEARTFPTAGPYPYHCSIHGASMNGAVIVRAP